MERIEYYTDYRKFLKDFYKERKKQFKYFSYRFFCKKAGIKSPSLFQEVVEGKRGLTPETTKAFIKGLGLTETDARFFKALVLFNQSADPKEKQEYLEQMRGLKKKVEQKVVPLDHYAYYTKWYHVALREIACVLDWKNDYTLLAKSVNPPITVRQAKESIQFLLDLGFIKKVKGSRYVQADPAITTGPEVVAPAVRELNRQMAGLAEQAVQKIPPAKRDISSLTVGISDKSYRLIKQEIQEFKSRVVRIVDEDRESDKVYNLNVQLFPLSSIEKTRGKGNV